MDRFGVNQQSGKPLKCLGFWGCCVMLRLCWEVANFDDSGMGASYNIQARCPFGLPLLQNMKTCKCLQLWMHVRSCDGIIEKGKDGRLKSKRLEIYMVAYNWGVVWCVFILDSKHSMRLILLGNVGFWILKCWGFGIFSVVKVNMCHTFLGGNFCFPLSRKLWRCFAIRIVSCSTTRGVAPFRL